MSFISVDAALGLDCSPTVKLVLAVLARHQNSESGKCCPSYAALAAGTGLDRATVFKALRDAREAGLVSWVSGKASHEPNSYSLVFAVASRAEGAQRDRSSRPGSLASESNQLPKTTSCSVQPVAINRELVAQGNTNKEESGRKEGVSLGNPDRQVPAKPEAGSPNPCATPFASALWSLTGRQARYAKRLAAWEGILAAFDPATLRGVLAYVKSEAGGWWRDKLVEMKDPCESLAAWLREDRDGSILHKREQWEIRKRNGKAKHASSPAPSAGAAAPAAEPLWDRYRMAEEARLSLEKARAYFAAHRGEFEAHPRWKEWSEDFKFRRIYV
jgi:hypothetical protein